MSVSRLNGGTNDEDERGENQRLATPDPVGNWPCYETCSERTRLLETDGQRIYASLVSRIITEGVNERL